MHENSKIISLCSKVVYYHIKVKVKQLTHDKPQMYFLCVAKMMYLHIEVCISLRKSKS